jgi:hypothetical protein
MAWEGRQGDMGSLKRIVSIGLVIAALGLVPIASAGSSLVNGYGSQGSKPVIAVTGVSTSTSSTPKVTASGVDQLPFTGIDLAVFVVAGAGLVIVGLGVRKLTRDEE